MRRVVAWGFLNQWISPECLGGTRTENPQYAFSHIEYYELTYKQRSLFEDGESTEDGRIQIQRRKLQVDEIIC